MENSQSRPLKLAVWNVERPTDPNGRGRKVATQKRLMEALGADVWVLTETRSDHRPGADFTGVCAPGGKKSHDPLETIAAVWARTSNTLVSPPAPVSRGSVVAKVCTGALGVVHVYASVIAYHGERTHPCGRPASKNWEVHLAEIDRQIEEWKALRDDNPTIPLIIAGDLNMTLSAPRIYGTKEGRELLQKGLTRAGLRCLTADTRDPDHPEWPLIDHIIVSNELQLAGSVGPISRIRDGVRMSDHPAVVIELLRR